VEGVEKACSLRSSGCANASLGWKALGIQDYNRKRPRKGLLAALGRKETGQHRARFYPSV